MSYLLALDAGTGSVRAVVFDLNGNQIAVGQAEWKHLSVENVPGATGEPPAKYPATSASSCTVPKDPLNSWIFPSAPTGTITKFGMF